MSKTDFHKFTGGADPVVVIESSDDGMLWLVVVELDELFSKYSREDLAVLSFRYTQNAVPLIISVENTEQLRLSVPESVMEAIDNILTMGFKKLWIDAICVGLFKIVRPAGVRRAIYLMGKLYYQGSVVPEVQWKEVVDYLHRGWMQQEILFGDLVVTCKCCGLRGRQDDCEAEFSGGLEKIFLIREQRPLPIRRWQGSGEKRLYLLKRPDFNNSAMTAAVMRRLVTSYTTGLFTDERDRLVACFGTARDVGLLQALPSVSSGQLNVQEALYGAQYFLLMAMPNRSSITAPEGLRQRVEQVLDGAGDTSKLVMSLLLAGDKEICGDVTNDVRLATSLAETWQRLDAWPDGLAGRSMAYFNSDSDYLSAAVEQLQMLGMSFSAIEEQSAVGDFSLIVISDILVSRCGKSAVELNLLASSYVLVVRTKCPVASEYPADAERPGGGLIPLGADTTLYVMHGLWSEYPIVMHTRWAACATSNSRMLKLYEDRMNNGGRVDKQTVISELTRVAGSMKRVSEYETGIVSLRGKGFAFNIVGGTYFCSGVGACDRLLTCLAAAMFGFAASVLVFSLIKDNRRGLHSHLGSDLCHLVSDLAGRSAVDYATSLVGFRKKVPGHKIAPDTYSDVSDDESFTKPQLTGNPYCLYAQLGVEVPQNLFEPFDLEARLVRQLTEAMIARGEKKTSRFYGKLSLGLCYVSVLPRVEMEPRIVLQRATLHRPQQFAEVESENDDDGIPDFLAAGHSVPFNLVKVSRR